MVAIILQTVPLQLGPLTAPAWTVHSQFPYWRTDSSTVFQTAEGPVREYHTQSCIRKTLVHGNVKDKQSCFDLCKCFTSLRRLSRDTGSNLL